MKIDDFFSWRGMPLTRNNRLHLGMRSHPLRMRARVSHATVTHQDLFAMGVNHGGEGGQVPFPRIWSGAVRDTNANCHTPRFCHIGTKGAFCGPQNTPTSVFGEPRTPLCELTTLPRPPSRLGRGHPSPYPITLGPTHLRRSPCVPGILCFSLCLTLVCHHRGVHFLVIALCKVMRFYSCRIVTTPTFLRRLSTVFFCSF